MPRDSECPECGGKLIYGIYMDSCLCCDWSVIHTDPRSHWRHPSEPDRHANLEQQHHVYVKKFRAMWLATYPSGKPGGRL